MANDMSERNVTRTYPGGRTDWEIVLAMAGDLPPSILENVSQAQKEAEVCRGMLELRERIKYLELQVGGRYE